MVRTVAGRRMIAVDVRYRDDDQLSLVAMVPHQSSLDHLRHVVKSTAALTTPTFPAKINNYVRGLSRSCSISGICITSPTENEVRKPMLCSKRLEARFGTCKSRYSASARSRTCNIAETTNERTRC